MRSWVRKAQQPSLAQNSAITILGSSDWLSPWPQTSGSTMMRQNSRGAVRRSRSPRSQGLLTASASANASPTVLSLTQSLFLNDLIDLNSVAECVDLLGLETADSHGREAPPDISEFDPCFVGSGGAGVHGVPDPLDRFEKTNRWTKTCSNSSTRSPSLSSCSDDGALVDGRGSSITPPAAGDAHAQ